MLTVSSTYVSDGLTHAIISALELPPKLSYNNIVSFESLKGIYFAFNFMALSFDDNIEITLPSVNKDLLIWPVSLAITPSLIDSLSLSLPAKSTNEILPYLLKTWLFYLSSILLIK